MDKVKNFIIDLINTIKTFIINKYDEYKTRKELKKEINEIILNKKEYDPKDTNSRYIIILSSLRKTVPKEADEYEDNDGDDENGKPIIRRFPVCPVCYKSLYLYDNYCPKCGQKMMY